MRSTTLFLATLAGTTQALPVEDAQQQSDTAPAQSIPTWAPPIKPLYLEPISERPTPVKALYVEPVSERPTPVEPQTPILPDATKLGPVGPVIIGPDTVLDFDNAMANTTAIDVSLESHEQHDEKRALFYEPYFNPLLWLDPLSADTYDDAVFNCILEYYTDNRRTKWDVDIGHRLANRCSENDYEMTIYWRTWIQQYYLIPSNVKKVLRKRRTLQGVPPRPTPILNSKLSIEDQVREQIGDRLDWVWEESKYKEQGFYPPGKPYEGK